MAAFRVDNSISWGDIGMALTAVVGIALSYAALSARVDVHDERIQQIGTGTNEVHNELRVHIQQEASDREAVRQELRGDLKEINDKLDKLIEREISRTARDH